MTPDAAFEPPLWLRSAHVQTVFASFALRRLTVLRRAAPVLAASEDRVLDCGDGVRLLCHYSRARPGTSGSLVVLLHGWEGSSESLYVLSLAQELFARGHGIVRLNFRDHGPTHHLNPELFHSCRLPEIIGAIGALQAQFPGARLGLGGFSLGGNFVLRVAAAAPAAGLDVARVLAVSPVLDPEATLGAMERGLPFYQRYFMVKWTQSLRKKQAAWPGRFDFSATRALRDLRRMTDHLVRHHTEYATLEAYLAGYALVGDRLAALEVPATLLTAEDDPIIPVRDLARLARRPSLDVRVTRHGGHCAFLDSAAGPSYADRIAVALFSS